MLCLLVPATAGAEIYKYVDDSGVMMLTDTPTAKGTMVSGTKNKPPHKDRRSSKSKDVHAIIVSKADKYDLDPALINAVIRTESAYDTHAISHKGAMGLMQLMPGTARDLGVKNPFNPEENIEGGTRYLKNLIKKYNGDITRALAAYNAGPRRVETSKNLPTETKNYIKKVYSIYNGERQLTVPKKETVIYRVVLEDGQVLFTNSPLQKKKVTQSL